MGRDWAQTHSACRQSSLLRYSRPVFIRTFAAFGTLGAHGFVRLFSPPDDRYFCERVGGMTRGGGLLAPPFRVRAGRGLRAEPRRGRPPGSRRAARRTRLAVSMTRAAILISRSRRVENSAFARSRGFGMASRTVT